MTLETERLDGTGIHYELSGEGPPIILINPGALDCRIWEPQWTSFRSSFQVLRYDPRGWGRSEKASGPFSHVRDLDALLDAAKLKTAYIVGSSFGGSLALDFAVSFPERVDLRTGFLSPRISSVGSPRSGKPCAGISPRVSTCGSRWTRGYRAIRVFARSFVRTRWQTNRTGRFLRPG